MHLCATVAKVKGHTTAMTNTIYSKKVYDSFQTEFTNFLHISTLFPLKITNQFNYIYIIS